MDSPSMIPIHVAETREAELVGWQDLSIWNRSESDSRPKRRVRPSGALEHLTPVAVASA